MSKTPVDTWFDAFRNRDISALEENLAEDFIHSSPFGEIEGKKAYLDLVKKNPDAFFDHTISVIDVFDCGDKFAARYEVDGTPACECIYVTDGKISKIYAYLHVGPRPSL